MFQFDSVHASIYYICIRTRTVKILQAMSLLLHSGSLSLSLSLGIPHNSKSLTVCYQHVVSHSKCTAPYMVYLTVYLCWGISFWVYTSSDSFFDLSPLIILRENLYQTWRERETCSFAWGIDGLSVFYIWVQNIWEFTMRVDSVRVYHGSWFCETLPFGLIVRVYHESWLWVYHESWFCKSLPWELTVRVYHERADCEFTMRVDCIRVYHESSLWEFTMRVDC